MNTFEIKNAKLFPSSHFTDWIFPVPEKLPKVPLYERNVLKRPMTDAKIQKEWNILPYSVPELLALLTALIGAQPKGTEGALLTDDVNLFYVQLEDGRVVAVYVYWRSDDREWDLRALDLADDRWLDGYCVFSRSADLSGFKGLSLDGKVMEIEGKKYRLLAIK